MEDAEHTAAEGMWSYACGCLACRWEQYWNEDDETICPEPSEPYPAEAKTTA